MGVYDQGSRYVVKRAPGVFFAWCRRRFWERFAFQRWADTTTVAFPGEPDRVCDTVAEFVPRDGTGPPRLVDVEAQSEPDPEILERQGEYLFRLRREIRHGEGQSGKYRVVGVLLTLTGPEQPAELDMREADLDDTGVHLRVWQVVLSREDAGQTLACIATDEVGRPVLPWVPLMRGGGDAGIIAEWKRLALEEPDEHLRGDYGGLALVFAELASRGAVWRTALEGWNVKASQQVLEWQAQARTEGKAEGRVEGRVEQARQDLLRVLQRRLQGAPPPDVKAAIDTLENLDDLARWLDAAISTSTLNEFRAAVGQPAPPVNGK